MTHTISGTFNTLVTLGSALYNPTTITTTGRLNDGLEVSYSGLAVVNAGSVAFGSYAQSAGVNLVSGGSFINQSGGSVGGFVANDGVYKKGIYGQNATVTVVNAGYVRDNGQFGGIGIDLLAGGSVTNQSGGTISGYKVAIKGAITTVLNAGMITGGLHYGIRLTGGGTITNSSGGTISALFSAIDALVAVTMGNSGIINGGEHGVRLFSGGNITNQSGGTISARYAILAYGGATTVVNAGTIASTFGESAVQLAGGFANLLVVDPGAVFVGPVNGGNTIGATSVSTLELAGTSAGTVSGVGTQFVNFAQTTIDTAASWTFTGNNTLAAGNTLTNAGTLTMLGATLSDAGLAVNNGSIQIDPSTATLGTLIGTGRVTIGGGSTLDVLGSVAAGEAIAFGTGSNRLGINPTEFAAQIDGFIVGDTIELTGVTDGISAAIVNGNTLQIERNAHPAVELKLDPTVDYTGNHYAVGSDGAVTEAPCFLRGTLIRTERGEVAVQDLAVGESVLTMSGKIRPITWVGTGHVVVSRGRRSAATPVIVQKGALADHVPDRDLRVTKGHSLYFDGVLVPIEYLVNHRSILWDDRAQEVELYHLELESHDVLLANGAPAESYRDDGNRWLFQNGNGRWGQPPQEPCAPVLTGGPVVDALWQARRQCAIEADAPGLSDGYHALEAQTGIRWTNGDAAVPAELFAGLRGPGMLILQFGAATQYLDEGAVSRAA